MSQYYLELQPRFINKCEGEGLHLGTFRATVHPTFTCFLINNGKVYCHTLFGTAFCFTKTGDRYIVCVGDNSVILEGFRSILGHLNSTTLMYRSGLYVAHLLALVQIIAQICP